MDPEVSAAIRTLLDAGALDVERPLVEESTPATETNPARCLTCQVRLSYTGGDGRQCSMYLEVGIKVPKRRNNDRSRLLQIDVPPRGGGTP